MFKVLIVDDEAIIRKGLKNIIDWNSFDCEVCGEAADGIEGMNLIKEKKPDIVITDIRMPEVDGLEMIKDTKEIIPDCKIVILTGYRNFEYIQEAIKMGAFDYVLKPTKMEDIISIIKRAVAELKFNLKKEEELKSAKEYFNKRIPVLTQKLLYDIMFTIRHDTEELNEEMKLYDIKIDKFIMMLVETDEDEEADNKDQYEKQIYQLGMINTFKDFFSEDYNIIHIPINNKQVIFIVQAKEGKNLNFKESVYKSSSNFQMLIKNCFNFTITVAISTVGEGIKELSEKTKEVMEAINYKFYMGKESVILFEDIKNVYSRNSAFKFEDYRGAILSAVKSGNDKAIQGSLNEVYKNIISSNIEKEEVRGIYWSIISAVRGVFREFNINEESNSDLDRIFKEIQDSNSIDILNDILKNEIMAAGEKIQAYNKKNINSTLKTAIEYINNNYEDQITLNEVAEHSFVSTYYLSRMFTKEMGKNFVDYLNEVRIEKAKEYLKKSEYKTYEVAELVGIKDAHYFSKLFKKYTGITPSEYKEGI